MARLAAPFVPQGHTSARLALVPCQLVQPALQILTPQKEVEGFPIVLLSPAMFFKILQ